ncbi:MAG: sugar ABC transporter substrate-binding protein [Verrucomicrobia bacterium]|nr:sugar ABC transporter substrate-binding protein [Verrucomicrobiota bacterium]
MINKASLYFSLLVVFSMLLGACAPAAPTEAPVAKTIRIGLVIPDFTQNQLILDLHDQAVAAAQEYGVELLVEGKGAAEDQVAAVENYIAAGVDVLVYDTTDGAAMTGAIEQANKAGIPVVCIVSCANGGKHAATVMYNYRPDMGQPLGEWIASAAPAGSKVGVIDSNQADMSIKAIYDGMYDGIGDLKIEVIVSPPTNWDKAAALDIARTLLTANPDFDVIIGFHDLIAAATLDAMAELGYATVPVAGLGGTCEGLANLLAGRQSFPVLQPLAPSGYQGIKAAAAIARGETLAVTEIGVPMIALTRERAEAILAGTEEGQPEGVDVLTALKAAKAGC